MSTPSTSETPSMAELTQQALADRAAPDVKGGGAANAAALANVPTALADGDLVEDEVPADGGDAPDGGEGDNPAGDIADANQQEDLLIAALQARNFDTSEYTGDQFLDEVQGTFTENQELRTYIQRLEAQIASGGSSTGAGKPGSPDPTLPAKSNGPSAPSAWNRPAFDKRMLQFLEKDPESGDVRVKLGGDPTILRQYHEYQTWRQEIADRWEQDPAAFIQPFVEPMIQQALDARLKSFAAEQQQQTAAERHQTELNSLLQRNGYFVLNGDGTVKRNAVTGREVQTPEGTAFLREYIGLCREGIPANRAMEIASRLHPGKSRTTQARPAGPATTTNTQQPAPQRQTIGQRMRNATRSPSTANNAGAHDFGDRVPSMAELQQQMLARRS